MAKDKSPAKENKQPLRYLVQCFAATIIPTLGFMISYRPFTQDHFGMLVVSVIAGGFLWWTVNNLLSGVYTSRQGNFSKAKEPGRYWLFTMVVLGFTAMAIWVLIHHGIAISSKN